MALLRSNTARLLRPAVSVALRSSAPSWISACRRFARPTRPPPISRTAKCIIRSTSTPARSVSSCSWRNTKRSKTSLSDYPYFSSYSDSWLKHCENYCDKMTKRFGLNPSSFVVEVASNDGYLLQYFVRSNVPVLGIEPAANVAKVAVEKGVPTLVRFLGAQTRPGTWSRNVAVRTWFSATTSWRKFRISTISWKGLKILLKPAGVLTLEFPHLLRLIEWNEFDTIYHEHFSYFSLLTTHEDSGSTRHEGFRCRGTLHPRRLAPCLCVSRREDTTHAVQPTVAKVIDAEKKAGLDFSGRLRTLRGPGERNQIRAGRISSVRCPARQEGCRLRCAGKERDAAALLRHRHRT